MAARPGIRLLVIDDNPGILELMATALAQPDIEIFTATDPHEGLRLAGETHPHIVLTDLMMPGISGLEVLDRILAMDPSTDVILMTAHYSTETAVEAIKKGATDYLNKPISIAAIREKIRGLVDALKQRQKSLNLENELLAHAEFEGIIGNSPMMWDMFSRVRRVAPHYRSVLVTGGTGTGKDLVARALHRLSPAVQGRLVVLNCSAVVETLFESELFGHARGAFTGANADKPGLVEHADGGTLFLDEIGDMPLSTQAKLLRVLQNQEVQRVGSLSVRKVDIRVIAATHRDLRAAIEEKAFREDLYYRLAMVEIHVPRLAERLGDLPLLTRHFVARFNSLYGRELRGVTRRAEILMATHSWPGNVRELENVIGHAAMLAAGEWIDVQDLPPYMLTKERKPGEQAQADQGSSLGTIEEHERALVMSALANAGGNQSKAARELRIGRDALRYKMKKYGLDDVASATTAG
ncbi:MAG: sigma-54-dependent Fis family transcriptional regulator [Bryobacterales bacterium]|nr:sigma-54-dependent Fis family transcriptional regulator [Bryobacterales bacterium]